MSIEYDVLQCLCFFLQFMKLDPRAKGDISLEHAVAVICEILRVPAPMGDDPESTKARYDIIEEVEMKMKTDPSDPARLVVKYGPFLKVRATRCYYSFSLLILDMDNVHVKEMSNT